MKSFLLTAVLVAICCYAIGTQADDPIKPKDLVDASPADDDERFYIVLLAHQSHDNVIAMSHTLATFLRTKGPATQPHVVETCTINWLPVSGHISIVRLAEPGVNKSVAETLDWAKQNGLEITLRGPFEIDAAFYQRAVAHAARLERGEFKYRCYNTNSRNTAKNCINAVADIYEDEGRVDTGMSRGHEAMLKVVEYFQPRFKSSELTGSAASSLVAAMKLDEVRDSSKVATAAAGE